MLPARTSPGHVLASSLPPPLAVAAYAFSALFNGTGGNHRLLFLIGAAMLIASLLTALATSDNSRAVNNNT